MNSNKRRNFIKILTRGALFSALPFSIFSRNKERLIANPPNSQYQFIDKQISKMKVAYILFDRITLLDFIGIYDPLSRIKSQKHMEDFAWDICGTKSSIKDNFGLEISIG